MKRELKFRAWHKDLKLMLYAPSSLAPHVAQYTLAVDKYGNTVEFKEDGYSDVPPVFFPASMLWDGSYYVKGNAQDVEWMKFTGIKDKDGKEIYEGDIVEFEYDTGDSCWDFMPEEEERIQKRMLGVKLFGVVGQDVNTPVNLVVRVDIGKRDGHLYMEFPLTCLYRSRVLSNIWENDPNNYINDGGLFNV